MSTLEDKDILELVLGGQVVRDMSATTFLGWVAGKLNGVPTYRADTQELLSAVSNPPMGRSMPDGEKIRIIRKLEALNISIV